MELSRIELKPISLHWLDGDPHDDYCVHGGVYFKLGDQVVSDGKSEWALSTAAFRLLRTVTQEHLPNMDEALIPCCGFNIWLDEAAEDGLCMPNCNNGIDWLVKHQEPNLVVHLFGNKPVYTDLREWSIAVSSFSDEIYQYLHTAWPKNFYQDDDKTAFELFMRLWEERRNDAECINASRKPN